MPAEQHGAGARRRTIVAGALVVLGGALLVAALGGAAAQAAGRGRPHQVSPGVAQSGGAGATTQQQPLPAATAQVLPSESDLPPLTFYDQNGDPSQLFVTIADTLQEQNTGLMNVSAMPEDEGEIFIFDGDTTTPFYMKDTLIPLSVAFVRADGTIVDIQDMAPETLDLHVPAAPYRYAVEANLGWYAARGIVPGDAADASQAYAASPVYGNPAATPAAGQ